MQPTALCPHNKRKYPGDLRVHADRLSKVILPLSLFLSGAVFGWLMTRKGRAGGVPTAS